jgi:hypothetical protein
MLCRPPPSEHGGRRQRTCVRTDPTYLAVRHSHDRYERVHHHWRVRWRSGADDHSLRPKRRGRDCQQLRANAALLIEWLFICHRKRWLPDHRPRGIPEPERIIEDYGGIHATKLADYRHDLGLDYPHGSKAVALKIAGQRPTPGSRRPPEEDPVEPDDQILLHPALEVNPDPPSAGHAPQNAAEVDLDDLPF